MNFEDLKVGMKFIHSEDLSKGTIIFIDIINRKFQIKWEDLDSVTGLYWSENNMKILNFKNVEFDRDVKNLLDS